MNILRKTILILLLPLLVLETVADVVDQGGPFPQILQISFFSDDGSLQCEKHHLFAAASSCPPPGAACLPVSPTVIVSGQLPSRLPSDLPFYLRAPPAS